MNTPANLFSQITKNKFTGIIKQAKTFYICNKLWHLSSFLIFFDIFYSTIYCGVEKPVTVNHGLKPFLARLAQRLIKSHLFAF